MDGAAIQRVVEALDLVYGSDTSVEQRRQAEATCEQLRNDAEALAYGLYLAEPARGFKPAVRHFGLQLVEHAIRHRWNNNSTALRDSVLAMIFSLKADEQAYIREKLTAILAMIIVRAWPSADWTDLSEQLMRLYSQSAEGREMALSVWRTLGEEMFVYDRDPVATIRKSPLTNGIVGALLPRSVVVELYPTGYRLASDAGAFAQQGKKVVAPVVLEPGNEDGWMLRWAQYASELAGGAAFARSSWHEAQLVAVISTISVFLGWIPIRALVATQIVPRLAAVLLVRGSDQARRLAAEALETVAKRSAASGEDRDTVLRQLAQDTDALSAIAQAYATTLPPAVDDAWEDAAEALAVARTIAQTGANLVTTHWARKKADETTASRALDRPQQLVELLVALARDPRYTVAAPALGAWGAILRHSAVARDPVVAGVFSVLTEHATAALFSVCRASHEPRLLDLMDPHEADLFESVGDARAFLATEIRAKLLGVVRGMCQLDPAGFVAWIHASLASALGPASPGEVVEAALMIVDAILAALDDLEQRALEDSDAGALASLQAARTPCYALGQRVVGLITCDANSSQLTVRQLATLPALAVLVRPSAVADAGGPARQLLLGMLQKCAACLHPSDQPVGKSPGDGALVAKRASAALVRLATAVPDSLMLVYADLAQLVHSRVTDPGAPRAVKAYLREFQLALIAGASTCTVAERRALARPIIEPMAQELADLADASMHAPGALAELLGLPLADHLCAHPGSDLREQLAAARVGRWRAVGVVSVLAVCMGRTLGGAMGCADLAPVWAEYSAGLVRALLAVVRCIHALWAQWPALPWQSAQAREALFGIVSPTGTPADSTAADAQGALTELRTRAYHCLGRLMSVPALFAGAEGSEPAQSSELAQSFAACVFGDAESLAPRHWHLLLTALASPALRAVGNWPGQDVASRREQSLEAVRRFVPPWLDPLLLFSSERLATQWHDLSAAAARRDEADEIAHENALREWTRSWSLLLADLLRAALVWIPDAARIEHDLASAARISPAAAQSAEHGNGALGLYLLGSQDALAGALTACLVSLRLPDTQSAGRVAALLGVLAPSLALIALMPCYDPPTPAHASTVSAYVARLDSALLQGSDAASGLGAWLSSDCVAALAAVLTSPQLVSVHDQALLALADLLYYSASFEARMPWAIRRLASTGDPPGQAMRHEMLRSLLAALHQGASGPPVCLETAELAAAQVAAESDAKRRRALLRVALQPAMAVETSKMFGDSAKPLPRSRLPTSGERDVSESWSNKKGTQVHGSVLDDDEHFDLGLLMP